MPVQVINGVGLAGIRGSSSSQSTSFDSDAQAFITSASLTATTQQNAVNDLVLDLKAAGLWTKMKALYPMVGGTAASHKWNLKDPRDLDAAFRLSFNGGWTHSSNGATPNGSNAYANTNIIPSSVLTLNSTHLSFYSRTNSVGANMFGVSNSTQGFIMQGAIYGNNAAQSNFDCYNAALGRILGSTVADSRGFAVFNRSTSNSSKIFWNNSLNGSITTTGGGLPSTFNLLFSARNFNGTIDNFDNKQCAFTSIGDGLTDIESNLFYQIVEKFQYALGRNVNTSQSFYYNRNYSNQTNAFIFNAGITGTTQQNAIVNLVNNLTSAGLLSKMKTIYPMVGGTANSHKFNLVNPVDSNDAFRLSFNGGWTHSSSGATPNGSNGYADTFLTPSTSLNQNNTHLSVYSRTDINSGGSPFGVNNGAASYSNQLVILPKSGNAFYGSINQNSTSSISNTNGTGFYLVKRTTSTGIVMQKNNIQTSVTISSSGLSTFKISIGATNAGGTFYYDPNQLAFVSIGDGLTDLESNLFYQIVERYQYELGRNVNTSQTFYYSSGYTNETNAFIFNGGVTDSTQISAVNTLVSTLKTAGIWSKMKAVYPMVGGTAISHKFNLVNPTDSDSAFRLTFNGGWTHSSTGVLPNGSNTYADTFLIPSTTLSQNNTHVSVYSRTNIDSSHIIGSNTGVPLYTNTISIIPKNGNLFYAAINQGGIVSISNTDSRGLFLAKRTTSTAIIMQKNSTQTSVNINSSGLSTFKISLGAINSGGSFFYGSNEIAFATIGDGLTDAEALTFYNAVQTYQTTLGRQV
jgi:hypothetical protein